MSLDLIPFENALNSLDKALIAYDQQESRNPEVMQLMRDGVIQRFEYTFELSWKMLKRYLQDYGLEQVDRLTNRQFFRMGFEQGLLTDAEAWMEFMRNRNLTSHTYNEKTAQIVFDSARQFLPHAQLLLQKLKERDDA